MNQDKLRKNPPQTTKWITCLSHKFNLLHQ